jgi:hypothetical protein
MSADLIQSMRPDPGSEGVDGGLHAIRLTNHRRIFLKRAYRKDDNGNDAREGIRVSGRTRSKNEWQTIVDILSSGMPKEKHTNLKRLKYRLVVLPPPADPVVYRGDKILPYCKIVFDVIHSAWVACLERDRESGGMLLDCTTPSIGAVFDWISSKYADINRNHVCLFLETRNIVETLPLNGKVNLFFDQLKSTSKAKLRQKNTPEDVDGKEDKDDMEEDDDIDLVFLDKSGCAVAMPEIDYRCDVPYFGCHIQCQFCALNQELPLLTLYDDEPLAAFLCSETSSWWPRPFIQTYAKLLLHSFHAPNASTDVVVIVPKSVGRATDHLFHLHPRTKYLFHVAMNSKKKKTSISSREKDTRVKTSNTISKFFSTVWVWIQNRNGIYA